MKSDIDKEIEEARKNLAKLEAHKRSLEERGSKYNYIGKYFVQNMYEAGTRYFHCIGARGEMDELELQGYGVVDNSYLINDDKGLDDFGSSAYFINLQWLEEL